MLHIEFGLYPIAYLYNKYCFEKKTSIEFDLVEIFGCKQKNQGVLK